MAENEFSDVRTLYSYTAHNNEELSFESGMVLKILKKEDDNWWLAQHSAKTGLVPSNYVEEVIVVDGEEEDDSSPYADPVELLTSKNNQVSTSESNELKGKFYVITKYVYKAQRDDELSFEANVILEVISQSHSFQGWWKAKNKSGKTGLIPSNYVKEIASAYISPSPTVPGVFLYGDATTTKKDENQNVILTKKEKADLLVERKNVFPVNRAPEAKESPGVKILTKQLITEQAGTKRDPLDYKDEAWYFGQISRGESEQILEASSIGSFLIRDSESTVSII